MIGRAFAAIILIPNIGFMGACLASPIAWIAADAFYSLHSYIVPRNLMQGTILNQTNNMTKGRTILPSLNYSII